LLPLTSCLAATNKYLAQSNKSPHQGQATKKRRSPTGFDERARLAALRNVGPGTMAAMNKSLARSNKSRTRAEATKEAETEAAATLVYF
jgi:hypothetical protein